MWETYDELREAFGLDDPELGGSGAIRRRLRIQEIDEDEIFKTLCNLKWLIRAYEAANSAEIDFQQEEEQ